VKRWTGFNWLRIGYNGLFCEHGNEPSVLIKSRNFLTILRTVISQERPSTKELAMDSASSRLRYWSSSTPL
jgi:hypothetical protein